MRWRYRRGKPAVSEVLAGSVEMGHIYHRGLAMTSSTLDASRTPVVSVTSSGSVRDSNVSCCLLLSWFPQWTVR
jgi:hypothetical protein